MLSIDEDLTPEKKKQLIQFYKAIKAAATMFPQSVQLRQKIGLHVDEIVSELKKDTPDTARVQQLTEQMQAISASVTLPGK